MRARPVRQQRQVDPLAAALGGAAQQRRIDLAVVGQVQGDVAGAAEQRMLGQLTIEVARGPALLLGRKGAALGAQQAAQGRAGVLVGVDHRDVPQIGPARRGATGKDGLKGRCGAMPSRRLQRFAAWAGAVWRGPEG
ncbi:hypothetical protein D3C78_950820 [compost metagenome]